MSRTQLPGQGEFMRYTLSPAPRLPSFLSPMAQRNRIHAGQPVPLSRETEMWLESMGKTLEERPVCRGESKMSHCPWLGEGPQIDQKTAVGAGAWPSGGPVMNVPSWTAETPGSCPGNWISGPCVSGRSNKTEKEYVNAEECIRKHAGEGAGELG